MKSGGILGLFFMDMTISLMAFLSLVYVEFRTGYRHDAGYSQAPVSNNKNIQPKRILFSRPPSTHQNFKRIPPYGLYVNLVYKNLSIRNKLDIPHIKNELDRKYFLLYVTKLVDL